MALEFFDIHLVVKSDKKLYFCTQNFLNQIKYGYEKTTYITAIIFHVSFSMGS